MILMRKLWFSVIIFVAVLFAACSPTTGQVPNTPEATSAPAAASTPSVPTLDPSAVTMECNVVSMVPTPGPTEVSMFPPVSEEDWQLGASDPVLTLTIYSDFQCPYCAELGPVVRELAEKHPNDVQVVFRHFPLPNHPLAKPAAYAAEAAGRQGKFWEMHDRIFAEQATWNSMTEDQFKDWLLEQAVDLDLDEAMFTEDAESKAVIDKVEAAQQHGLDIQIPGTPMVLVNGQYYQGPRDLGTLESLVRLFELEPRQFTYCPPMVIDPEKEYTATLKTEKGDIVIQLLPDKAPLAVNSFVFLAQQGWFDNVMFHRVLPGFVAQTGDPSGTGFGNPGYIFANETSEDLKFDKPGVVGMANSGADSNGSQFFITYAPAPNLNGSYTIFGEVIEGMDVAESLTERDPSQFGDLPEGDLILSVEIQEK